ncbi:Na(+)-translocating NADH-quinone reductase subunit A [Roseivirga sp. BDSF3-8]|uniref:Na(+)-translocating NADH-quinone reductase subunit A n=1 Tax=Roseivirga sp. BDSF3-8 TaxID=3241598 RepID=UPI0035326906
MTKVIKLKRGFDINLKGKAENTVSEASMPKTFALKPTDFLDVTRPKVLVEEGETVKAGTPLVYDKKHSRIMLTSPVSGEVVEVKRGKKRKLLEVVILADSEQVYEEYPRYSVSELNNLTREQVEEQMLKSGVWPQLVQRPYGLFADPEEAPKAIHVSGFDTHPLAPDYDVLFKGQEQYFQAGIDVLKKLTPGTIHLNVAADREINAAFGNAQGVQINKFSGPHPAGNPGVQIHHLDPVNRGDIVWTIRPFGVIQIGKLFLEGKYDASRIVALAGSEVEKPQYYKTYQGAKIESITKGKLTNDHVRYISGNVLTGTKVNPDSYLGYYDDLISVIPEGDNYELLGWIKPTRNKLSYHRAFGLLSFLNPNKEYVLSTNMQGEERAFVQTGTFESVMPMDILPTHLIKAIMAEDYDDMESLGIYEVIEEDMALCEFVDVSKHDIQAILREGLDLMKNS